jgi:TonB family protein
LEDGSIDKVEIVESSGFPRLDQGAIPYVQKTWKLFPATRDGKPVAATWKVKVTFKLK